MQLQALEQGNYCAHGPIMVPGTPLYLITRLSCLEGICGILFLCLILKLHCIKSRQHLRYGALIALGLDS